MYEQVNETANYETELSSVKGQGPSPDPECEFSVLDGGPNGQPITGTVLDTELYYSIKCKPKQVNLAETTEN